MAICGPKLSLCTLMISVWGILQLSVMGILFYIKSVALIEDIPVHHEGLITDIHEFYDEADHAYEQTAQNCWIAAAIYVGTLVISGQQFYANSRSS